MFKETAMEKLNQIWASITVWFSKWWIPTSVVLIATLYFLLDRRGRTIEQLKNEVNSLQIKNKLAKLTEEANKDETAFKHKLDYYNELKRKHSELSGNKTKPD